jgi:transketolase
MATVIPLDERSLYLRRLIVSALDGGRRGHLGSSLSMVEVLRVLFDDVLQFRPSDPTWSGRDRFILSKGHGCLTLYALLADKGFFPTEELRSFCHRDSRLGGHPERGKVPGVEATTGALGHGLPLAVGMALALRILGSSSRVFVMVGDGELNEGSNWEAALSAGKHGLDRLTLLVDYNKLQSYGPTRDVLDLEPLADKFEAFGFATVEVDGHDVEDIRRVLGSLPVASSRPTAIICHTVKGKGVPFAEGKPEWHHKSNLSDEELGLIREALVPVAS